MALVVYERRPVFVHSRSEEAAALSAWDPYRVLGLPAEPAAALFAAAEAAAASAADGEEALRRRAAGLRAAYLDLAAKYHPDADAMPASATPWLSAFDHFAAIAAAYRLLSDVDKALQYALATAGGASAAAAAVPGATTSAAASNTAGTAVPGHDEHDIAAMACADVRCRVRRGQCVCCQPRTPSQVTATHPNHLQKYEDIAREERRRKAAAERLHLVAHIAGSYEAQHARHEARGDGCFVLAALYGDARVLASLGPALAPTAGADGIIAPLNARALAGRTGRVIDVTGVLQGMVEVVERDRASESTVVQLVVPAGTKTVLEGFWDPTDGAEKKLWVRYEFLNNVHEVTIADDAPLKCPVKSA